MNELKVFEYNENQIRTFVDDKCNLWLVAKDVCGVLGYAMNSSIAQLISNVPMEWKGIKPIDTPGGEQDMLCLSEQGLYFFLARSDKPSALPFQKWIAGDVIPSIRKTGGYNRAISRKELAMLVIQAEEEKEKLLLENRSMKPKVEFFDAVTGSKSAIDIGSVAKILNFRNIGRNSLFRFLRDHQVLMSDNIPYQEYIDKNYFRTIEQKWRTPEGETRITIKTVCLPERCGLHPQVVSQEGFSRANTCTLLVRGNPNGENTGL